MSRGLTLRQIAAEVDRSVATVRYWLERHGLRTRRAEWQRDPSSKPRAIVRRCAHHGHVRFTRTSRGTFICPTCAGEKVARRRRRMKAILIDEAGGCCTLCGYDRFAGALHFHHVDPSAKSFGLASKGVTRSLDAAREEARKCVLLCSNCHAEVEGGVLALR